MNEIAELVRQTVAAGLQRKSVTTCARWAEKYRVMGNPFPGPFSFDHHPWLYGMHMCEAEKAIGQKAAQMGFTEWAMNTAFFYMDVKGMDVLYVLPTSSDASDFSAGRFDPALELSPHLQNFFADVNNVGLKRAGSNMLYVRGSGSRSQLKSIPTPVIIFDELDEMPKESIALAEERQSGQLEHKTLGLSTPSIEDFGVNAEYKNTTQEEYTFKCPHCNRRTELSFPDCLVVTGESLVDPKVKDSYIKCKECDVKLDHSEKINFLREKEFGGTGEWVPRFSDRDIRGFHISQLYSMVKAGTPYMLALAVLKARLDPTRAQELWNSKLGLCFEADGARITEKQIADAIGRYYKGPMINGSTIRTMGVDVGSVLHIVVKEFSFSDVWMPAMSINDLATARVLYEGTTSGKVENDQSDFGEARQIFEDYRVHGCVVDAEPERREALRFAQSLWGRVLLCDYLFSQAGREASVNEDEASIKVNRTAWMDVSLGRFRNGSISIPVDTSLTYKRQLREPVRVYKEDKRGNKFGVYENVGPDHFAHADTYAEIALPLAASLARNQDITELY